MSVTTILQRESMSFQLAPAVFSAASMSGATEMPWREAGGTMKGAYEIGKIVEADIGRDICDRAIVVGQQSRRMA